MKITVTAIKRIEKADRHRAAFPSLLA